MYKSGWIGVDKERRMEVWVSRGIRLILGSVEKTSSPAGQQDELTGDEESGWRTP